VEEEEEEEEGVVVASVVVVVVVVEGGEGGEEEEEREADALRSGTEDLAAAFFAFLSAFSRCLITSNRSLNLSLTSGEGRRGIKCSNSSSPVSGIGV